MLSSICLSARPSIYRGRASRGHESPGDDLWIFFKDLCDDGVADWLRAGSRAVDSVDAKDPKPLDLEREFYCPKGRGRGSGRPSRFDRPYAGGIPAQARLADPGAERDRR